MQVECQTIDLAYGGTIEIDSVNPPRIDALHSECREQGPRKGGTMLHVDRVAL